jgi:hypothetical protein
MTSLGSVSIGLQLDRRHFNRDLAALKVIQIPALTVDTKLNVTHLQKDIANLSRITIPKFQLDSSRREGTVIDS